MPNPWERDWGASEPSSSSGARPWEKDWDYTPPAGPSFGENVKDVGTAVVEGVGGTWRSLKAAGQALVGDNAGVEQTARDAETAARTTNAESLKAFKEDLARRKAADDSSLWQGLKNVAGAAWDNPAGAVQMTAEQLPNMAAAMVPAWAGFQAGAALAPFAGPLAPLAPIAGGVLGYFAGNAALETGGRAIEKGADGFTDEERAASLKEGAIKGTVITGVDAVTFGATKMLYGTVGKAMEAAGVDVLLRAGVNVADKAAVARAVSTPAIRTEIEVAQKAAAEAVGGGAQRAAAATGLQVGGESLGEGLGEYTATGTYSPTEAVLEGLSSAGQSAAEITIAGHKPDARTLIGADLADPIGDLERKVDAFVRSTPDPAEVGASVLAAPTVDDAIAAAEQATSTTAEIAREMGAALAPVMDRQAALTEEAATAGFGIDREMAQAQAATGLEAIRSPVEGRADAYADLAPMDARTAQGRLRVLRDAASREGGDPASLVIAPHPNTPGRFAIARQATAEAPAAAAPAATGGGTFVVSDAIGADGPAPETVRLIVRPDGSSAIVRDDGDVIDVTNMIRAGFTPERAIAQALGDDTTGANVTRQQDATTSPAETQHRIESAALAGRDAARRAEDAPRQELISRAMRSIEERGGVASPAEAQIVAEAGLGRPYDRIDESLAPALTEDQKLTQATGIALDRAPRESAVQTRAEPTEAQLVAQEQQDRSDSRLAEVFPQRAQATAEAPADATAAGLMVRNEAPLPSGAQVNVDGLLSVLKNAPALRNAQEQVLVREARAGLSPQQFDILQRAAVNPPSLSATDRLTLRQMREGDITFSEQRPAWRKGFANPAPAQAPVQDSLRSEEAPAPESQGRRLRYTHAESRLEEGPGPMNRNVYRLVRAIGRLFGKKVQVFTSERQDAPDGYVLSDDGKTIYLNANSQIGHLVVFGHELMHQLKRDNPAGYEAVRKVVRLKEGANLDVAGIRGDMEELTSDLLGNRFKEPQFWVDVFNQLSRPEALSLGQQLRKTVQSFIRAMRGVVGYDTDALVANLEEVKAALTKALADYARGANPRTIARPAEETQQQPAPQQDQSAAKRRLAAEGDVDADELPRRRARPVDRGARGRGAGAAEEGVIASERRDDGGDRDTGVQPQASPYDDLRARARDGRGFGDDDLLGFLGSKSGRGQTRQGFIADRGAGLNPGLASIYWSGKLGGGEGFYTGAFLVTNNATKERTLLMPLILARDAGGGTRADLLNAYKAGRYAWYLAARETAPGVWDLVVDGADPGKPTYDGLVASGDLTPAGNGYHRLKLPEGTTEHDLLREGARRLSAVLDGRTPEITFSRATGANPGRAIRSFSPERIEARFSEKRSPWYSALGQAIEGIGTKAAPAAGWRDAIKGLVNKGAVKADEVEWSGVNDWLDLQQGKVTREQIAQYLEQNGVQVEEVVLGGRRATGDERDALQAEMEEKYGTSMWYDEASPADQAAWDRAMTGGDGLTRYETYTLPGGTNYREVLLTLPERDEAGARAKRLSEIANEMADATPERYAELHAERARLADGYLAAAEDRYKSSHWDQPNVLAHIRVNDRTDAEGRRVLFVEELQSDWAQEGKKKGFRDTSELKREHLELRPQPGNKRDFIAVHDKRTGEMLSAYHHDEKEANEAADELVRVQQRRGGPIQPAPFVTATDKWLGLALKRVVKMAVDEGYDKVAFVTGEQSEDRYWGNEVVRPAVERWNEVTKPQSIRELGEDVLGREMAALMPLDHVDAGVLAVLKHDQVRRAVVEAVPVDVVNMLRAAETSPDELLRKKDVVASRLPVDSRRRAADGILSALRLTGAAIRAELGRLTPGGSDIEVLPALRASQLNAREVAGLLDPVRLFHRGASGGPQGATAAGPGTEPLAGKAGGVGGREQRAAELAGLLNAHASILGRDGLLRQGVEPPPGEGMKAFYDKIVPQVTKDVLKKLGGGQIDTVRIPVEMNGAAAAGDVLAQPGFAITPQMREKAEGGLPLFSERRIFDDSGRAYTPEQRKAFESVGFSTEVPTLRERLRSLKKDLGKKVAQGMFDQFLPIKDLSQQAYGLARLSRGSSGAVEALLHHGKLKVDSSGVYDADTTGGAIERVFTPLGKEVGDFLRWVAANRAERLMGEGRENLFSPEDIAAIKSLDQGTADFDYTLSNGQTTRDRTLIYRDALKRFDEFNKNVLDVAQESGLIDRETRPYWEHEFYVPFYRVSDKEGFAGPAVGNGLVRQQAFKALKGGTDKLNSDLLSNTLMNWAHLIDASAKNRAAIATLEAAEAAGIAIEAPASTAKDMAKAAGGQAVWVMDEGQKRHFVVNDPFLLTAITSLQYAGLRGGIMDAMSKFKHWMTVGVTASPAFKIRNLIRDSVQAVATSDLSGNVAGNLVRGFKASDRSTQTYVSALAGGGLIRFGTMLEGREADRVRRLVKMGVDKATILDNPAKIESLYNVMDKVWSAYQEVGNRSEEINRSALYEQLLAKGLPKDQAALAARDLTDFSLQGSWPAVRFLTQVVPFMNARLQGLYKLGRAAKENPAKFGMVVGAVLLASLALMAAYHDDEDWKKREDWDRDNYWWFKVGGVAYRIPKPFEVGAIATAAERGVELFFNPDMTGERYGKILKDLFLNNLSMNPVPQAVKPIIDVYSNKDSFTGRPIETLGMQRLDPEYRYNSQTSMPARAVSTATGGAVSPVQVDHLARAYFGWLGSLAVGAADMATRPLTNEPKRPTPDYWKVATQGIAAETGGASSYYVTRLYEQAKEMETAYATWRALLKEGRADEAKAFFEDNREKIAKHKVIQKAKEGETKFGEMIRAIERSNLDPDVKKERIRQIRAQQDRLARTVAAR